MFFKSQITSRAPSRKLSDTANSNVSQKKRNQDEEKEKRRLASRISASVPMLPVLLGILSDLLFATISLYAYHRALKFTSMDSVKIQKGNGSPIEKRETKFLMNDTKLSWVLSGRERAVEVKRFLMRLMRALEFSNCDIISSKRSRREYKYEWALSSRNNLSFLPRLFQRRWPSRICVLCLTPPSLCWPSEEYGWWHMYTQEARGLLKERKSVVERGIDRERKRETRRNYDKESVKEK